MAIAGGDADSEVLKVRIHLLKREEWNENALVGAVEKAGGGPAHGADHLKLLAIDGNNFADRIFHSKQALLDIGADGRNGSMMEGLVFAEEAAFFHIDLTGLRERFFDAAQLRLVNRVAFVLGYDWTMIRE